ncbi:MAG: ATP-binding protein [Planctomycetota bacterium]
MPRRFVPFRAIAESTYDWEMWIEAGGRLRWVNPAVERFTGLDPDACLADPRFPLSVVDERDRDAMRALLDRAAAGASGNDVEFRVVHRDGSSHWASMSFQPLVDGGVARGFRTSVRDIDERKRFEERLSTAEREASRAAGDRADLLATLSHELRSPLHCIAGYADILRAKAVDPETARQAGIVVDQSESVLRLVEDLLRYVAGEATASNLVAEPFDLGTLVRDVVEVTTPRARPRVALRFVGEANGPRVIGDRERLRQVVTNLVDNALRYTTVGEVVVTIAAPSAGRVRLEVADTGPGMSDELRARARQPFVQGPGALAGGVGLGLAIVDRLVRSMAGRFELESELGRGTRAIVDLPLPPASVPRAPATDTAGPARTPLRILVVDDSEAARELVVSMVRALGHEADEAASGALALAAARVNCYDLVLVDYHMPEQDGVSTATALAAAAATPPFVVLLTANVLVAERASELPRSIDRVVAKPLRLARLRELAAEAASSVRSVHATPVSRPTPRSRALPFDDEPLVELLSLSARGGRAAFLVRMREALAQGYADVAAARPGAERAEAAHGLKGLLLSVGAASAAALAARVEARARAGRGDAAARRALAASQADVLAHVERCGASLGRRAGG